MSARQTKVDLAYALGLADGKAAAASEPVTDDQVQRAWKAAQKRQQRKTFNADPLGMVRLILETGRG